MGLTNASGPWYLFWSGIFGDVTIFAAVTYHFNCHVSGCWRMGRLPVGDHKVCRKHHPDPPTHQHILDLHRKLNGD